MPGRILDIQFPTVNPSGATSASGENIPTSPNMFGGLAAQAEEGLGQGIERAGNTALDLQREKQQQLNAVDTAQRHTNAVKKMTDINEPYLSTEGHAAILARPDHDAKIKGAYDDALENASNPAVKRGLATALSGDVDRFYRYSAQHSAQQETVFSKKVAADKTLNSMDQAVWAYRNGDLKGWNDYRKAAIEETRNTYLHDLDPNETDPQRISDGRSRIEAEVAKTNGKIVYDTTKLILDHPKGGPQKAGQFAKEYEGEVDAKTNVAIDDMLKGARATQVGQSAGREALERSRTPAGSVAGIPANFIAGIKSTEGFAPQAKWDYKQFTNGYGTRAVHSSEVIDEGTANQRFNNEISRAAKFVDSVNPNLDPGTRAALTSLTFNAGEKWAGSGLGEKIRAGDVAGAKADFLAYNHAGGVVNQGLADRRAREAAWFGQQDVAAGEAPQAASYQAGGAAAAPGTEAAQPAAVAGPASGHGYDFRAAERSVLDNPDLQGNPAAQAAAFAQIRRVREVTEGQAADEERAQRAAEKQAKKRSDDAELAITLDAYSGSPTVTSKQIIEAGQKGILTREAVDRSLKQIENAPGQKYGKEYGPKAWEFYERIHLPEGDPMKITDPAAIYKQVHEGNIFPNGAKELVNQINKPDTAEAASHSEMEKQFLKSVHHELSYQDPDGNFKDPSGERRFTNFMGYFFPALQHALADGKTHVQLLTEGSPDYLGKAVDQFRAPSNEEMAQRLKDAMPKPEPGFFARGMQGMFGYPVLSEVKGFDESTFKSAAEMKAALLGKKLTPDEWNRASKIAIDRGWAPPPPPTPLVPQVPISQ